MTPLVSGSNHFQRWWVQCSSQCVLLSPRCPHEHWPALALRHATLLSPSCVSFVSGFVVHVMWVLSASMGAVELGRRSTYCGTSCSPSIL